MCVYPKHTSTITVNTYSLYAPNPERNKIRGEKMGRKKRHHYRPGQQQRKKHNHATFTKYHDGA